MSVPHPTHKHEETVVDKARGFWVANNKAIIYVASAVVLLFAAFVIYKYMYKIPRNEKANEVVFVTQKYFNDFNNTTDSSKALMAAKVLNGDGVNPGALKIMNDYSGSDASNLCAYYAGASYLHLGQFDKAIKYLKEFNADGATQIKSRTLGMLGDASAELSN